MNEKILGLKRNTVSNPYIVVGFPDLDFIKKIKRNDTFFLFLSVWKHEARGGHYVAGQVRIANGIVDI